MRAACILALSPVPQLLAARLLRERGVDCSFTTAPNPGDTCSSFADNWGISVPELQSLNPGIQCPNLDYNQSYCVIGTVTTGSSSTSSVPTSTKSTTTTTLPTTTTTAQHSPTQSGLASNCDKFHKVVSGDQCGAIEAKYSISASQFSDWNPSINADCTNLWVGYYVCVHVPGATTSAPTSTPTGDGHSPTQPGIAKNCDKYHKVVSGDQCGAIEKKYGISQSEFSQWNPYINSGCTNLWLGYYVCVHVPNASTVKPTSTPTPHGPQPQRPGTDQDCKKYYKVQKGDSCYSIEQSTGISLDQLRSWNTAINRDCTNLWAGYYICVAA